MDGMGVLSFLFLSSSFSFSFSFPFLRSSLLYRASHIYSLPFLLPIYSSILFHVTRSIHTTSVCLVLNGHGVLEFFLTLFPVSYVFSIEPATIHSH
ncbi:uncharacterized protein BO96DRAFT_24183 [Aspergillus niger CBS 101883]|uniref:uncharacterized protein n=1 Tax=Aspergillus lacticoffeatus (strain CBS 101883) TaxID=1450533 RepID=UPI000D7FABA4|nr:uncharacterized protein BO96DRAFT_24183 [Aspergillus niger CBS 101883]PYH62862.1 hypothetical protein BO96DRAFT_24183 [Aspergillus niger CBS 101883]